MTTEAKTDDGRVVSIPMRERHWRFVESILRGEIDPSDGAEIVADVIDDVLTGEFEPYVQPAPQPADTYTPPGEAPKGYEWAGEYRHAHIGDLTRERDGTVHEWTADDFEIGDTETIYSFHILRKLPAPLPTEGDIKELVKEAAMGLYDTAVVLRDRKMMARADWCRGMALRLDAALEKTALQ